MGAFSWDGPIKKSSEEFVILEPGEYDFTVVGFERAHYEGSERLPACPMAVIKLRVSSAKGDATVTDKLRLCSELEWLISAFFESIGMKKKDEEFFMDWNNIIGKKGRVRITKSEGRNPGTYFNNVDKYLPPVESKKFGSFKR